MKRKIVVSNHFALELLPAHAYETQFNAPYLTLGIALDDQTGTHALASSKRKPFTRHINTFAVTPAGCDVYSYSDKGGEYLTVTVLQPEAIGRDPALTTNQLSTSAGKLARAARRHLLCKEPTSFLEIDRLGYKALAFVDRTPNRPSSNALTPQRRRKLRDYIEARLAEQITVKDLANQVQLSPRYFSGIFEAGLGQTPHDYIVERRITRARALLLSKTPLSQIACATGFSSQAHLSQTFRQRLRISPSNYRKAISS